MGESQRVSRHYDTLFLPHGVSFVPDVVETAKLTSSAETPTGRRLNHQPGRLSEVGHATADVAQQIQHAAQEVNTEEDLGL